MNLHYSVLCCLFIICWQGCTHEESCAVVFETAVRCSTAPAQTHAVCGVLLGVSSSHQWCFVVVVLSTWLFLFPYLVLCSSPLCYIVSCSHRHDQ